MIAKRMGLHQTTVSMALRNHPKISEATRQRVKAVADAMGYCPDPKVSELMQHLRTRGPKGYQETVAFVIAYENREDWEAITEFTEYLSGARQRAEQLGYKLEVFWLADLEFKERRLERILKSRSIRGLIAAPLPDHMKSLDIDWDSFSSVTFGYRLETPNINRVVHSHIHSINTIMGQLATRGYRKIGLALSPSGDARMQHLWSIGFLGYLEFHDDLDSIPICFHEIEDEETLLDWFRAHEPEAVVSNSDNRRLILARNGFSCPSQFGFAHLAWSEQQKRTSGIDQQSVMMGATAVDQLVGSLYRNERGVPQNPHATLTYGKWVEGKTLGPA